MSRQLRVARVGVRFDLDVDRTAEIREHEPTDISAWLDTFAAVAAGDEVFVIGHFYVGYANCAQPSFGSTHGWSTLSTRRDVSDDLVRLADEVYTDGWPTELADMRMAGWDVDRAQYQPAEAVIDVGADLRRRIVLSRIGFTRTCPAWRIGLERHND